MRRLVSILLGLGLSVGLLGAAPLAASAHDVLERTNPADGTTVSKMPATVVLTFSEAPLDIGSQVVVTGPSGPVSSGAPTISGRDVTQSVAPNAPGGDYTVTYRVTSDDGHPVTGTFSFHATIGLDGSTATAGATVHVRPADSADQEAARGSLLVPILLTVVTTILLLALAGYLVLRGREADRRT
ncbi:copper resistance CopC family protein [Terrabacter sp. 2RAF25]|uniref:copper resistance CopC family protein n=1 Tax=Terrabacter sp. 2RAF25 TaxID=3232998 RepID=UPI003F969BFD